jgi:hypothetical protein
VFFGFENATRLVHHGRRQEFEVADPKLAAFIDENDRELEI